MRGRAMALTLVLAGLVPALALGAGFYDEIKSAIGSTDDEWKVIQPLVQKVLNLRFGMDPLLQQASQELGATLSNRNCTDADIAVKLKALREAKERVKADLAAAQNALMEVVLIRQEAVLVQMGVLD